MFHLLQKKKGGGNNKKIYNKKILSLYISQIENWNIHEKGRFTLSKSQTKGNQKRSSCNCNDAKNSFIYREIVLWVWVYAYAWMNEWVSNNLYQRDDFIVYLETVIFSINFITNLIANNSSKNKNTNICYSVVYLK